MDQKISEQFEQILHESADQPVSLGYLMSHFGHRSYGLIMLALSIPNMLPIYIPGLSVICGLPIFIMGYQMARRRPHPSLPSKLQDKSFERAKFNRVIQNAVPYLQRVESILKPRWPSFTEAKFQPLYGLFIMFLSAFMLLPLPGTNILPAYAIGILALGFTEEDGVFISVGLVGGVLAAIATTAIIGMYMAGLTTGLNYFI